MSDIAAEVKFAGLYEYVNEHRKRIEAIEDALKTRDQYAIETRGRVDAVDQRFGVLGDRFDAILDGPEQDLNKVEDRLESLELTVIGHKEDRALFVSDEEVETALGIYQASIASGTFYSKNQMRKSLEQFLKERS